MNRAVVLLPAMRHNFTFWLAHVAQHPGLSFVQHVLQEHHVPSPGFHAPHQAEGDMLTPEIRRPIHIFYTVSEVTHYETVKGRVAVFSGIYS